MPINVILIESAIFTVIAVVLLYVFIIPDKKRKQLNSFGAFIHDLLNFKFLTLEKIFQFFYVLTTVAVIIFGFFMIFWVESLFYSKIWLGYIGIIILLAGPIVVRISFEFTMMIIIGIKNVIEINQKLSKIINQNPSEEQTKNDSSIYTENKIKDCSRNERTNYEIDNSSDLQNTICENRPESQSDAKTDESMNNNSEQINVICPNCLNVITVLSSETQSSFQIFCPHCEHIFDPNNQI